MSVHQKISPFGPAVWPALRNIYAYECLVLLCRYKVLSFVSFSPLLLTLLIHLILIPPFSYFFSQSLALHYTLHPLFVNIKK